MRFRFIGYLFLLMGLISGAVMAQDIVLDTTTPLELATEDGSITMAYPEGWPIDVAGMVEVYVANSTAALDNPLDAVFAPGEVKIGALVTPVNMLIDSAGLTEAETVMALMEAVIALPDDGPPTEFSAPQLTTLGDAVVSTTRSKSANAASYGVIRLVTPEEFLLVETITAPGELDAWLEITDAMVTSVDTSEASLPVAAEATPVAGLTETYVDEDIPLTVNYPAGWVTRPADPNGVDMANHEAALDLWTDDRFAPGDIRAFIGYGPAVDQLSGLEVDGLTPAEIFEVGLLSQLPANLVAGQVEELSINDFPAATVTLTSEGGESFLVLADYGDGTYLTADIRTAPGELEEARAILMVMLETVEISAGAGEAQTPPLDATYVSEDGRLTIAYPEGWFVRPGYPFTVDIANTEAGLDQWLYDSFAPGDVRLSVGVGTGDELFEGIDTSGLDVLDLTAMLVDAEAEDERVLAISEPEALTVNGQPAAAVTLTLAESENYSIIVEYDDVYVVASVQTAVGELEAGKALLLAMLETLEVGL